MVGLAQDAHGERVCVWSWMAYDREAGADLVFAVAASDRAEVTAVAARLGVPEIGLGRLRPRDPGYAAASRHPGQLMWTPLDRYASAPRVWGRDASPGGAPGSEGWCDEEQLLLARGVAG